MSQPPPPFPNGDIARAARAVQAVIDETTRRGWSFSAYNEAVELLKAVEERLSTRKRIPLKRFLLIPLYLWMRGLEQMAISYGRGYALAFFIGIGGLLLSRFAPADIRPTIEILTLGLNAFVALTLVFAAPSTYCSAGTNMKHVDTVTNKLHEWKVESPIRVDLILKNLRVFEERVRRRLVVFRWLLGAGWALYFSPLLTESVKAWSAGRMPPSDFVSLFPPLGVLFGIFVIIEAYARGVDILFRCLELGCNERLADLDLKSRSANSTNALPPASSR